MKRIMLLLTLAMLMAIGCDRTAREERPEEMPPAPERREEPGTRPPAEQPGQQQQQQAQGESEADRALARNVHQAFLQDPALSTVATEVTITAENGTVTLKGTVENEQQKSAMASKAQQVAGVQRVDNQLQVMGD
jgi:hypothetical protein